MICTEVADGWSLFRLANLYAKWSGNSATGETKVKNSKGKDRNMDVPSSFHFHYVKDDGPESENGIVFKKTEMMLDSGCADGGSV